MLCLCIYWLTVSVLQALMEVQRVQAEAAMAEVEARVQEQACLAAEERERCQELEAARLHGEEEAARLRKDLEAQRHQAEKQARQDQQDVEREVEALRQSAQEEKRLRMEAERALEAERGRAFFEAESRERAVIEAKPLEPLETMLPGTLSSPQKSGSVAVPNSVLEEASASPGVSDYMAASCYRVTVLKRGWRCLVTRTRSTSPSPRPSEYIAAAAFKRVTQTWLSRACTTWRAHVRGRYTLAITGQTATTARIGWSLSQWRTVVDVAHTEAKWMQLAIEAVEHNCQVAAWLSWLSAAKARNHAAVQVGEASVLWSYQQLRQAWHTWVGHGRHLLSEHLGARHAMQHMWVRLDDACTIWRQAASHAAQHSHFLDSAILFHQRRSMGVTLARWNTAAISIRDTLASYDLAGTVHRYNDLCSAWNTWWAGMIEIRKVQELAEKRVEAENEAENEAEKRVEAVTVLAMHVRREKAVAWRRYLAQCVCHMQVRAATSHGRHLMEVASLAHEASLEVISCEQARSQALSHGAAYIIVLMLAVSRRQHVLSRTLWRMVAGCFAARAALMTDEVRVLASRTLEKGEGMAHLERRIAHLTASREAMCGALACARGVRTAWDDMNAFVQEQRREQQGREQQGRVQGDGIEGRWGQKLRAAQVTSELVLQINRRKRAWMAHKGGHSPASSMSEHKAALVCALARWRGVGTQHSLERMLNAPQSVEAKGPDEGLEMMFDDLDVNRDGVIDRAEFEGEVARRSDVM